MTTLAALNNVTTCQVIDQAFLLQFIRQLYEVYLERHGPEHEQTRVLQAYIAELETRAS